jgi:hypothetical protein
MKPPKMPSIATCRKHLRKVYPGAEFEFEGEAVNVTYVVPESGGLLVAPVLTLKLQPKDGETVPSAQQLAFAATIASFRTLGFDAEFKPGFFGGGSFKFTPVKGYVGVEEGLDKQIAAEQEKSTTPPAVKKEV